MIMLTLVGSFMAFTGIILHSISKMMNESKKNSESPSGLVGLKDMRLVTVIGARPELTKRIL